MVGPLYVITEQQTGFSFHREIHLTLVVTPTKAVMAAAVVPKKVTVLEMHEKHDILFSQILFKILDSINKYSNIMLVQGRPDSAVSKRIIVGLVDSI